VAAAAFNLAEVCRGRGDQGEAKALYEQALSVMTQAEDPDEDAIGIIRERVAALGGDAAPADPSAGPPDPEQAALSSA
jgi:hypothetical protein